VNDAAVLRHVLVARPESELLEKRDFVVSRHGGPPDVCVMDLSDHAVLPALFNAHDHLHQNGVPPLPTTEPFRNSYDWAAAFGPHFDTDAVKQALAVPKELRHWQGALKNALCGVATVMHHDPPHAAFDLPGFPVRTVRPFGWAHSLHWSYGPPVTDSFRRTPSDVGWFIHIAEGTDEIAAAELQELRALDCLRNNTVLIHGVGLDDEDVRQIIARRACLVWCPASNLAILGKTVEPHRLRMLFAAGLLMLGTDSRLSGSFDLLAELKIAARFSDFTARELVQLVTVTARRLLHSGPARDDLVLFRRHGADPFQDLLNLTRGELRAVVRDGEPLIADPDFEPWFVQRGIPFEAVCLDGQAKLCARTLLAPSGIGPLSLEPGLFRND
jgi:hypothetical protein